MSKDKATDQAAERAYDRVCPLCGTINRRLYLQETKGLYECERCGSIIHTDYPGFIRNTVSARPRNVRRIGCDR